jgi:hypothetical protein
MCGKEHEAIKYLGVLRVPALYGAESRFTSSARDLHAQTKQRRAGNWPMTESRILSDVTNFTPAPNEPA